MAYSKDQLRHIFQNKFDRDAWKAIVIDIFGANKVRRENEEFIARIISVKSYEADFFLVNDILNGKRLTSIISSKNIDNAVEYYKQLNKSLLNFRYLNTEGKLKESKEIDDEAISLKNDWYKKLSQMQITII